VWQYLLVDNERFVDILTSSEYKKILKGVAEEFIGLVEMEDYEEFENINKLKKEITEHFDKFFKDPEFDRLMSKAADWSWFFLIEFLFLRTLKPSIFYR